MEVETVYSGVFSVIPFTPSDVEGAAWIENIASRFVLEKTGFLYRETKEGEERIFILSRQKKEPEVYYEMTKERWKALRNDQKD